MPTQVTFYAEKVGRAGRASSLEEVAIVLARSPEVALAVARAHGIYIGAKGGEESIITDCEVVEL